ncbi:hypothetical protein ACFP3I_13125 [Chryseobacterium arachidis]|uniref:hypothetical protein n=1 Tax=Chryseobacterium arachidis TaxID=1416778 RepID=UPI000933EF02
MADILRALAQFKNKQGSSTHNNQKKTAKAKGFKPIVFKVGIDRIEPIKKNKIRSLRFRILLAKELLVFC